MFVHEAYKMGFLFGWLKKDSIKIKTIGEDVYLLLGNRMYIDGKKVIYAVKYDDTVEYDNERGMMYCKRYKLEWGKNDRLPLIKDNGEIIVERE